MVSWSAIHVETTVDLLVPHLSEWMAAIYGRPPRIEHAAGRWPTMNYAISNDGHGDAPSEFAVAQAGSWTTAIYNSFAKLDSLLRKLSADLPARCVVTVSQTTTDSYYFSYYQAGKPVRTLEWDAEAGWRTREGQPLPFESEVPSDDLHTEILDHFCERLGIREDVSSGRVVRLLAPPAWRARRWWWKLFT